MGDLEATPTILIKTSGIDVTPDNRVPNLTLTVNGRMIAYLPQCRGNLREMVITYLLRSKFIESQTQIADIRLCQGSHNIDVWLTCPIPNSIGPLSPQHLEEWHD
jgi:hypothetical protein